MSMVSRIDNVYITCNDVSTLLKGNYS